MTNPVDCSRDYLTDPDDWLMVNVEDIVRDCAELWGWDREETLERLERAISGADVIACER